MRSSAILLSVMMVITLSACTGVPIKTGVPEISTTSSPSPVSDPTESPKPETTPSSPLPAATVARQDAIDACTTLRDNITLAYDKVVSGQRQAAALAADAASLDDRWASFSADMSALARAPLPSPGTANPNWNAHLDAYFTVVDKDCTPLGIQLPQD